jgi:deazaflavin-dependent oxidoreductase (nitroreductase family)
MVRWPISDDAARAMYRGGRADATAKRYARFWRHAFALGLMPRRWVTLEVPGRRSGRPMRVPLGMADVDGRWYVVSMLGECNWVRNVRAAGGAVRVHHVVSAERTLHEVPAAQRPPILRRYVRKVPGGRPHVRVDKDAPTEAFEAIAADHPVFLVCRSTPTGDEPVRVRPCWPRTTAVTVAAVVLAARAVRRRRRPTDSHRFRHLARTARSARSARTRVT